MTELNCALMDAEPTLAAVTPEDETQSIHAWSQEDTATEVVDYRQHSWKSPLILIAVVAALLSTGFVVYKVNGIVDGGQRSWNEVVKPPQSATNPQVAPSAPQVHSSITASPPVQVQSPDQRFLALLKQRNVVVVSPALAINGAHEVCTDLAKGYSARDIAEAEVRATPNANIATEATFVATTQEVYCR